MPGKDKDKRVPPPPPTNGASSNIIQTEQKRRVPPPPPGAIKKKEPSNQGFATGLFQGSDIGTTDQGSGTSRVPLSNIQAFENITPNAPINYQALNADYDPNKMAKDPIAIDLDARSYGSPEVESFKQDPSTIDSPPVDLTQGASGFASESTREVLSPDTSPTIPDNQQLFESDFEVMDYNDPRVKKADEIDDFAKTFRDVVSLNEEDAVVALQNKVKGSKFDIFSFEEAGLGDKMRVTNKKTGQTILVDLDNFSDEANSVEADRLESFIDLQLSFPEYDDLVVRRAELINDNSKPEWMKAEELQRVDEELNILESQRRGYAISSGNAMANVLFDKYDEKTRRDWIDQTSDKISIVENDAKMLQEELNKFNDYKKWLDQGLKDGSISQEEYLNRLNSNEYTAAATSLQTEAKRVGTEFERVQDESSANDQMAAMASIVDAERGDAVSNIAGSFVKGFVSLPFLLGAVKGDQDLTDFWKNTDATADFLPGVITEEYVNNPDLPDWEKALAGISESIGAALSTPVPGVGAATSLTNTSLRQIGWNVVKDLVSLKVRPDQIGLFANSYLNFKGQLDNNPSFDEVSNTEKVLLSAAYGLVSGKLESFGLSKALTRGPKGDLVSLILKNVFSQVPKDASGEVINAAIESEIKTLISRGIINAAGGALAEGSTEAAQELATIGIEEAYNEIKGKGYFDTPDSLGEAFDQVSDSFKLGIIGGGMLSSVNQSLSIPSQARTANQFSQIESIITNPEFKDIFNNDLKLKVLSGEMTIEESARRVEELQEFEETYNSIPSNIENKYNVFNLVMEKKKLSEEIKGKDPNLVPQQKIRISQINEELSRIGEGSSSEEKSSDQNIEEISESESIYPDLISIEDTEDGTPEYKVGDKFYSGTEILNMLDNQEFINDVNNGSALLSMKNPSPEIRDKIYGDKKSALDSDNDIDIKTKKNIGQPSLVGSKTEDFVEDSETMTQEQFDDSNGKTDAEIIQEANNLDDNITEENIADNMIQSALDSMPEGQAPASNKEVFNAVLEKAKEINKSTGLKGEKLIEELSTQIQSKFDEKITKEDISDFQSEILAEIPKEVKISGKSVETITKDKFSAVSKAIRDKKFTSSMSDAMSQLKSSPLGVVTGVIDGAMEVVATTIDQAGTVAQAIENGLDVMKESDWYKNLSDAGKNAAEALFKKNVRKQIDQAVKSNAEVKSKSTDENKNSDSDESYGREDRRFSKKILESENIRDEIKEGLSEDAKKYVPISNDVSLEEADTIISEKGTDQAYEDVMNLKNGMDPRARVTLGIRLIEQFNASESEVDTDRAVNLADTLSQFATKLGQGVQAFSIWSRLSVSNIERSFNKKQKENRSEFKGKNPNLISGAKEGYDAGTSKAAKKAVGSVFGKNTKQAKKAKAFGMDKDQIAQRKKDALAKIKKATKGGQLSSGGINVELIEALGEYGFILFADGVRTFKEWSARMKSETGVEDEDILRSVWMDSNNVQGKSLNDLSAIASVETVVSDFFSKNTDPSNLSKKLQDTFGLDEETATGLALEITEEFEKIVVNSRKNEIKKRAPRLTKKALKAIDEIASSDGLTKEEIEGKIFEAFGLSNMSNETASKLEEFAKERDARPEGLLQDEITREMLSLIAKEEGIKASDIFWSVWYASVLSGYETQVLNIVSNSMNIAMEGLVTAIDNAILKGDPRAIAGSISGLVDGMKKGWREFEDVLSKGYSPERLRSKLEIKDTLENTDFWGGKLNPLSYYKYVGRFMSAVDTGAYLAAKGARKQQAAREIAKTEGLSGEQLSKRVSELLNDTDQVYNDALMQATQDVDEINSRLQTKMSERTKSRMISARADEIVSSKINEEVLDEARKFAEFVTYNYDPQGVLGWAANGLSKGGEKFKPFKLVVPFTRIVANVLNQQIDYTPYGYLRAFGVNASHWSSGLNSTEAKDSRDRRRQLIKATMGTFLMVGVYMLAAAYGDDEDPWFDITGKGPSDFNKRNQLLSQGWKPYHIKIGDTWYNYQYTPFGFALSYIGNWRDNEKYKELAEKDWITKSAYAFQSSASGVMDMSFLTGLSGLMSALSTSANPENIQDRLLRSVSSTSTSFIPNLFKQADRLYDPTVYDSKTISGVLLKDVPILKRYSGLKPKLNAFGQPVEKMGNRFFAVENTDPVWQFMSKNRVFAPGVDQDTKMPDGTLMTDDQMYDYVKESGNMAYEDIKKNMDYYDSIFATFDADQKQKFIQRLFRNYRKSAKGIVYMKTLK